MAKKDNRTERVKMYCLGLAYYTLQITFACVQEYFFMVALLFSVKMGGILYLEKVFKLLVEP